MTMNNDSIEPVEGALMLNCVGLGTFFVPISEIRSIVDREERGTRIKLQSGLFYNLNLTHSEVMEAITEARMLMIEMRGDSNE